MVTERGCRDHSLWTSHRIRADLKICGVRARFSDRIWLIQDPWKYTKGFLNKNWNFLGQMAQVKSVRLGFWVTSEIRKLEVKRPWANHRSDKNWDATGFKPTPSLIFVYTFFPLSSFKVNANYSESTAYWDTESLIDKTMNSDKNWQRVGRQFSDLRCEISGVLVIRTLLD